MLSLYSCNLLSNNHFSLSMLSVSAVKDSTIENWCYVVGVNRVGRAQVNYNGGSAIVDFQGTLLAACVDGQESSATAQLNMPRLMAFRKQFPVLHDADAFRLCEL